MIPNEKYIKKTKDTTVIYIFNNAHEQSMSFDYNAKRLVHVCKLSLNRKYVLMITHMNSYKDKVQKNQRNCLRSLQLRPWLALFFLPLATF